MKKVNLKAIGKLLLRSENKDNGESSMFMSKLCRGEVK